MVRGTLDGTVYVADTNNYTIRSITPAGVVATLAGRSGVGGKSDAKGDQADWVESTDLRQALTATSIWQIRTSTPFAGSPGTAW